MTSYDVDIIGFQEFRLAWKPYIDKYFGEHYEMFNKFRNQTTESELESAPILWCRDRFTCLKTGWFWLSDTPEVESRGWDERFNCYRICEYVILRDKANDECVTFMNTHFGFGDAGQVKSAALINKYSEIISDHPTLVVGDFNMQPGSAGYCEMVQRFIDVDEVTVKDRGCTYHGYDPEHPGAEHIDYCFVNNKVIPIHYEIIVRVHKEIREEEKTVRATQKAT